MSNIKQRLKFVITKKFIAENNAELLLSLLQSEKIQFSNELNKKEKYVVVFLSTEEINEFRSVTDKGIFVFSLENSFQVEDKLENAILLNFNLLSEISDFLASLKDVELQLLGLEIIERSHKELEHIRKLPISETFEGIDYQFLDSLINAELELLKSKNLDDVNIAIEKILKSQNLIEKCLLIKRSEGLELLRNQTIKEDENFLCFRVFNEGHLLACKVKDKSNKSLIKVELILNSIVKTDWNKNSSLVKNSGEFDLYKKVISLIQYPVVLLTEHADIVIQNERFASLGISPRTLLKIENNEAIDINNNFYKVKKKFVKIQNSKCFYYVFYTEEKEIKNVQKDNEAINELGIISSSIAHELNNPFAGILAALTLIGLDDNWDEESLKDIEDMKNVARRCKDLVEIFLGFSRYSTSKNEIDLKTSFDQAMNLLRFRMIESGVRLDFIFSKSLEKFTIPVNNSVCSMIFYMIFSEIMTAFSHNKLITGKDNSCVNGTVVELSNQYVIKLDEDFDFKSTLVNSKLIKSLLKFENLKMNFKFKEIQITAI